MKKLSAFLLVAAFLVFPVYANAYIIGDVTLTEDFSTPTGYVTFPTIGTGNYYLDYDAKLNGGAFDEAFCVEYVDGPGKNNPQTYTLLTIDTGLSAFGLEASRYLAAAWVAEYYYTKYEGTSSEESMKAGAQIAVWEIIFDGSFNLDDGNFKAYATNNDYINAALSIWNNRPVGGFPTYSNQWVLAVNPTVGKDVTVAGYQNYLVRQPVPEPATMLLLGAGLIGLAGFGRKKLFKK